MIRFVTELIEKFLLMSPNEYQLSFDVTGGCFVFLFLLHNKTKELQQLKQSFYNKKS